MIKNILLATSLIVSAPVFAGGGTPTLEKPFVPVYIELQSAVVRLDSIIVMGEGLLVLDGMQNRITITPEEQKHSQNS